MGREDEKRTTPREFLQRTLVQPLGSLYRAFVRRRRHRMRLLLWVSFFVMVLYYATLNDYALNYGYLKLKFDVTPEGFAGFNAIGTVGYIICIFGLLPLLRQGS